MPHLSEIERQLEINYSLSALDEVYPMQPNVEFLIFPYYATLGVIPNKENIYKQVNTFLQLCDSNSVICILCSPIMAADFSAQLSKDVHIKLLVAIKTDIPQNQQEENYIKQEHSSLLILAKYKESLKHTKTRIAYTYCPTCDKTTKDYGGKKHLYHEYGTLLSDVWRDIEINFSANLDSVIERVKDLFSLKEYTTLNVYDQRSVLLEKEASRPIYKKFSENHNIPTEMGIITGDCLVELRKIPENSIDFCFADPPYNLSKKYEGWDDGIGIQEYFNWCDTWLAELARVLKPGHTLAVLNIPQWCIRHFKFLITQLDYQDWIVWEGLSMPVRMIMPSHYTILCFTKGKPRALPGLNTSNGLEIEALTTQSPDFCSRSSCKTKRANLGIQDKESISNLWWDIHRLKHNSRRVDHPCQLPPSFMNRLISLFTNENEIILDPFNGVGTSTLCAHQLGRKYIGIELSEYYSNITKDRHNEILNGIDPFRKSIENLVNPKVKNSRVERLVKQKYEVSKKELQLDVKRISKEIGHLPSREEVIKLSQFAIKYYDDYFSSWGEVTAAAKTTGMMENRK